jgi:pimeloyl-ACP methyl ester carboxylesterase
VLERHHDVLAPTLLGHAGGPPLAGDPSDVAIVDSVEQAMDAAGFDSAHLVGNSLGGYLALHLAARGRAESVVALAPAGGWSRGDESSWQTLGLFVEMQEVLRRTAPYADRILATEEGRRRATRLITSNFEHIPVELLAHQMCGAALCDAAPLIDYAEGRAWNLDAERISCPVRIVWGTADEVLPWPSSAERYRHEWLPHADWIELDGVGHCPQLDVPCETAALILDFTSRARWASTERAI